MAIHADRADRLPVSGQRCSRTVTLSTSADEFRPQVQRQQGGRQNRRSRHAASPAMRTGVVPAGVGPCTLLPEPGRRCNETGFALGGGMTCSPVS